MTEDDRTTIWVDIETRDEILKPLKHGSESYDDVIRRLAGERRAETEAWVRDIVRDEVGE